MLHELQWADIRYTRDQVTTDCVIDELSSRAKRRWWVCAGRPCPGTCGWVAFQARLPKLPCSSQAKSGTFGLVRIRNDTVGGRYVYNMG